MTQLDLLRPILSRREFVMDRVGAQAWKYRADFPGWLEKNLHIWERFEREANAVYAAGRRHYSARTIGEFMRHETALKSANDGEWKLNNNRWPDLARVYLMLYPERQGFFELRVNEDRAA